MEHPDRLHDAVTRLRYRGRFTGEHSPRSRLSVKRVRLSQVTAATPIRPGHLDDVDALLDQEAGQADTEAARTLDACLADEAVRARPGEQLDKAGSSGGKRSCPDQAASPLDQTRDVLELVRVDAEDDLEGAV